MAKANLTSGINSIYQNGNRYLYSQSYVDKDLKPSKNVTLLLYNDNGTVKVSTYIIN